MSNETIIGTIVIPFVAVIVGGIITFLVSRYYYSRAGNDLEREAAKLRHLTTLVLRGMEEAGFAEFNRDSQGEISGIVINLPGLGGTVTMSGELSVDVIRQQPAAGLD